MAAKLASLPVGANQHAQICAPSQEKAAEILNVSRRSVQAAAKVLHEGAEDLIHAVEHGGRTCRRSSLMEQGASFLLQIFIAQAGLVGTKEPHHECRSE